MDKNTWLLTALLLLPCAGLAQPNGGAPVPPGGAGPDRTYMADPPVFSSAPASFIGAVPPEPLSSNVVNSAVPVIVPSTVIAPGSGFKRTKGPKQSPAEFASITDPESAKKEKKLYKVYEGSTDVKTDYKLDLPANAHWRILWKVEGVDEKKKAKLRMEVTSPADAKFGQGMAKEVSGYEDPGVGVINICAATGGKFNLFVETVNAKWRLELELLSDPGK